MPDTIYSDGSRRLATMLRGYRVRAGLTQEQVAQALGKSQSFVSDYERGQRRLDLVELDTIATVLGVKVESLVARWSRERDA